MTMQYKIMINNNSKDKYIEDNLWNNQETLASLKISGIPDTTRYPHNTPKKEEKSKKKKKKIVPPQKQYT